MIQEKDFLYRVPVKTALITTPRGQIRNPEILVDIEGGEFMHGNILDANSTNKLINQSVKDAVDDKFIESGYVTKDLLDAETTRATEQENSLKTLIGAETGARTKGDEDLSSKIQAEQTRAEGKEKDISDKLAIVDGDSNTEGSFRKAIADKLAGNDDLYTALNQAIATKADATALSNYVLTTALNQQVDTLNAAISAKQDAGNYIPYDPGVTDKYQIDKELVVKTSDTRTALFSSQTGINFETDINDVAINEDGFFVSRDSDDAHLCSFTPSGIKFAGKTDDDIPTADGTFINVNDLASADDVSSLRVGMSRKQNKITVNEVDTTDIETADITKLRTIVTNLIKALSASDLIRETKTFEILSINHAQGNSNTAQ